MSAVWTRVGALYVPMVLSMLAGVIGGRRPRQFAACLMSVLWVMPGLLAVQRVNEWAGWWSFASGGVLFCGMPLELYLGWVLLWGVLPQMAFPRWGVGWSAVVMIAVDLIAMPLCGAVVRLGPRWLLGEAVMVVVVLVPALCVARWTREDRWLAIRAAMQVVMAGMWFLYVVPEVAFALRPGVGWRALMEMASWTRQVGLQVLMVMAVPGLGAVMEFAERGLGTPIPYDAPKRLVTSGVYRYVANPMQVSCAMVMLGWAGMLRSGWMAVAAVVSVVYSAGIAEWDEGQDLAERFGAEWREYRSVVRNWWPRWRPYCAGSAARIYIAASCGPCREPRAWLEARGPVGLEILDAEMLPSGSIRRMRYEAGDGSGAVDGVRALGRALEHLHLGWAVAGAALRLPGVWWGVQLVMDASGLGPRVVAAS
jgi:protein-S-isoprenylcysteine O-methyltransferase Ste14